MRFFDSGIVQTPLRLFKSLKKQVRALSWDTAYNTLVSERVFLPLTDLAGLCRDIPITRLPKKECYFNNHFYGMEQVIKKYVGLPEPYTIKASYTHYPSSDVWVKDLEGEHPVCLVWGDTSLKAYAGLTHKPVYAVGPPIAYAQSLYGPEQAGAEKTRLGKNALIFPSHSAHGETSHYDPLLLVEKAKALRGHYDTVRFCIYWRDYQVGRAKTFVESGFECVSAGHMFDPLFLPRLKSLLLLASHTYGNSYGSHMGLSVGLGVPHTLLRQPVKVNLGANVSAERQAQRTALEKELALIEAVFAVPSDTITPEQQHLVDTEWGFRHVHTPEALRQLLHHAENLYQAQKA